MKPFTNPIYVTRPMLADLSAVQHELEEIFESQWLTNNGVRHQRLEKELAVILGVPGISLFNNGTIALLVAVRQLGFRGEVITTPFTFPATPHSLAWGGVTPVFCDIDEETLTLDAGRIEECITPATTGILGVHVYGIPCDVKRIAAIARKHSLRVMYDAAHAFGTEVGGEPISRFGDVSMFSFHATKLFHTLEGGALACADPDRKREIDLLRNFGIKNEDEVLMPGINGKMNEVQAAVGLLNLALLDGEREKRRRVVETYAENLRGIPGIRPVTLPAGVRHSFQYYVIRVEPEYGLSRDDLYAKLKEYNVFARKYFYPLCSDYPCYKDLPSARPEKLPIARKVVREVLCLPLYGALAPDDAAAICGLIRELRNDARR